MIVQLVKSSDCGEHTYLASCCSPRTVNALTHSTSCWRMQLRRAVVLQSSCILNRVGAVASVDSLKRLVHIISHERREAGLDKLLVKGAFTVATVDNIDFLQSHAAVYSGSQHHSWHATSIQLVQPKPLACNSEPCTSNTPSVRRQLFETGCSTPIVVTPGGKHGTTQLL